MNVWILDSESGVTLLYKPYMDMPVNEDLVSGLLTALNQFTMVEFKQPIESIDMGGLRWVYVFDKPSSLLFIGSDTKDVNTEMLRARISIIKQSFVQEYFDGPGQWKEPFTGNIERYRPFKNIINEYYTQWLQAESVTSIAEFFDILGIFQQILNLLGNIIEGYISNESRQIILHKIEKMFERFKADPSIKDDPGLSKISFSRENGFDVISVNPIDCDIMLVEKTIIDLAKAVVQIIKKQEGHLNSLNYFNDEQIFDYILNNLSLLRGLHLDKFLLQLFLLK